MSKLSFRARALDPSKQMPIYLAEELPDLPEYSAINRAVPQMPSGMEKEEESEHHLQRAICTGLIIPTPEVFTTDQEFYDNSYPPNYKMPRQLIHMQPLGLDNDVPEYDMDSADECWVKEQSQRLDLTPLKFEQMMNRLERSSGQTVVTLNEAKSLLKQNDEVSIAVYDYWLNKRLKTQHPLILAVKTENRPGISSNNPYLAFRRRTEKMQTRKNRKNDETSYEKMLKLRRDLQRATTMLEMVKKREKTKKEQLRLSIEIFEKRVELRDFNGTLFNELCATLKSIRPAFAPLYSNQYSHNSSSSVILQSIGSSTSTVMGSAVQQNFLGGCSAASANSGSIYTNSQYLNAPASGNDPNIMTGGSISRKEKRQYKKRKHKLQREKQKQPEQYSTGVSANASLETSCVGSPYSISAISGLQHVHRNSSPIGNESNIETEEDDTPSGGSHPASKFESDYEEELPYSFRRKQNCNYLKPLKDSGSWPWDDQEKRNVTDLKYRFTLTSLRKPRPRCIGFARRRVGRGGRIILDRVSTDLDALWAELDYTILETDCSNVSNDFIKHNTPENMYDNTTKVENINVCTLRNKRIKSENNTKYDVRLDLRSEYDIENSYVSEQTLFARNHVRKNLDISRGELLSHNRNYTGYNESVLSTNLSRAHVFKISQTLKKTGLSNVLLNGNIDKKDNLLNSLENRITEYGADIVGLNNNNINSNLNKNVNIVGKINVIKCEAEQMTENIPDSIKEEIINSPKRNLIDDTGGAITPPKPVINADICYDEDNVNLAQLSNIMKHTIKKEFSENESFGKESMNKIIDDLSETKLKNNLDNISVIEENCESLSPTSSLRLEACNDLLTEIRNDWLHFRPKTPSDELSDDEQGKNSSGNVGQPIVHWTPNTPISVEFVSISKSSKDSQLWNKKNNGDIFLSNSIKYSEIESDSAIFKSYYPADDVGTKMKNVDYSNSLANRTIDLNISGDSLNDINLLAEADESDENMLDNILQECQIDEHKALSQATNFWNGILDEECAVEEDGADIENGVKFLGDDRKIKIDKFHIKHKRSKINQGSTSFSVIPKLEITEKDFFKSNIKSEVIKNNVNEAKEDSFQYKAKAIIASPKENTEHKPITNLEDSLGGSTVEGIKIQSDQNNLNQLHLRQVNTQNLQTQRQQLLLQMPSDLRIPASSHIEFESSTTNSSNSIRQPALTPIRNASTNNHVIYTSRPGDLLPVSHKVAYIQKPQHLNQNTVIALSNIKLENDGTTVISQPNTNSMVSIDANSGLSPAQNMNISTSSSGIASSTSSSMPLIVSTASRSQHFSQHVQANTTQPQILWRQINASSNSTNTGTEPIPTNKIVWTSRSSQKRHINGPENTDINRLLLNKKISQRKVISQQTQQIHIAKHSLQQGQRENDATSVNPQTSVVNDSAPDTLINTTPKVQMHGKLIKIPSLPLLVSELQQKPNSVTIASSHNYNLPTSTMLSSQQVQTANKIVLSGTGSTSSSSLIGESQSSCNSGQISVNTTQKIHYKDLPNPSMKVNFVSNNSAGSVTQGNLVLDTKGNSSHQTSTVLLNKSTSSLQHHKLKPGSNIDNSKRVLYTSLLNVKNLQKTSSGQVQMQIAGGMTHAVLRGRIGNNQTIFTNMRTVPIGTSISSTGSQPQTLSTIVSGPTTNNISSDQLSKGDSPNSSKVKEVSKNLIDQNSCNSNISGSTSIGNLKLGSSVIISAANTNSKNTIVTSTTNR